MRHVLFRIEWSMAFFVLVTQTALSQDLRGWAFKANGGYLSSPSLNYTLARIDPERSKPGGGFFTAGFDTYFRNRRAIVMISAHGAMPLNRPAGATVDASGWMVNSSFGWVVVNRRTTWIYPSAGCGVSGLTLKENSVSIPGTTLERMIGPSVDVSLNIDHLITNRFPKDRYVDGVLLGVKIGYTASVLQNRTTPGRVDSVGQADFRGWYVTVSLGGLGFMKNGQTAGNPD